MPKAAERNALEARMREGARRPCLSNDAIGWLLGHTTPRQLDAVAGPIEHELAVCETSKRSHLV